MYFQQNKKAKKKMNITVILFVTEYIFGDFFARVQNQPCMLLPLMPLTPLSSFNIINASGSGSGSGSASYLLQFVLFRTQYCSSSLFSVPSYFVQHVFYYICLQTDTMTTYTGHIQERITIHLFQGYQLSFFIVKL